MVKIIFYYFQNERASNWILPVMQGFIQIERCSIDHLEYLNAYKEAADGATSDDEDEGDWDMVDRGLPKCRTAENLKEDEYDIIVISRRSRYRAGKIQLAESPVSKTSKLMKTDHKSATPRKAGSCE